MNCTDFELAVHDRLDSRQTGLTSDLAAHAASCATCQAFWREQQLLLRATASWPTAEVPAGIVDAVLSELRRSTAAVPALQTVNSAPVTNSRGGVWAAICATAALALIAVPILQLGPPNPPGARDVATVTDIPAVETIETRESAVVSQTLAGLWTGVRSEYQELAQNSSLAFDDWSALKRTADALPEFPAAESPSDELPADLRVPAWLRLDLPVSERAVQAFDFLRNALPHDGSQSS